MTQLRVRAVLSAGLCDAFDFVAFGDACAFDVFVGCKYEFVGYCFLDAEWAACGSGACAFGEVADGKVYAALWGYVY